MRSVEFIPFRLTDQADIYPIRVDNQPLTETGKFLAGFKDSEDRYIRDDFNRILLAIQEMATKGILERFFRIEGGIDDRVFAMPLLTVARDTRRHGTLRLYCLRISEGLLILGGGGLKQTATYDEDPLLSHQVMLLQAIDRELARIEKEKGNLDDLINTTVYVQ